MGNKHPGKNKKGWLEDHDGMGAASAEGNRRSARPGRRRRMSAPEIGSSAVARLTPASLSDLVNDEESIRKYREEEEDWLNNDALGFSGVLRSRQGSSDSHSSLHQIVNEESLLTEFLDGFEASPSLSSSAYSSAHSMIDADLPETLPKKLQAPVVGVLRPPPEDSNATSRIAAPSGKDIDSEANGHQLLRFDKLLTVENAQAWKKKRPVQAFRLTGPAEFKKAWGVSKGDVEDYVVIDGTGDMYCVPKHEFEETYEATDGKSSDQYYKKTVVLAKRMMRPFFLVGAAEGEISTGNIGDYVVQGQRTAYIVYGKRFNELYAPASWSGHSRNIKGAFPLPATKQMIGANASFGSADYAHKRSDNTLLASDIFFTDEVRQFLKSHALDWDCDIFKLSNLCERRPLYHMAMHIFRSQDLLSNLGISDPKMAQFVAEIEDAYLPVPYHSSLHGCDVLHAVNYFFMHVDGMKEAFGDIEYFSLLVGAMCHDIAHPGTNATFLINAKDDLAIRFNDTSVLENFHAATTMEIVQKHADKGLLPDNFNRSLFRQIIIKVILATDLADRKRYHLEWDSRTAKTAPFGGRLDLVNRIDDRQLLMKMIIKCADLAHPTKNLELHKRWSILVNEEFRQQAVKETMLGLPRTAPSTTDTGKLAKSQTGFIRFVVEPCYVALCSYMGSPGNFWLNRLTQNKTYWNAEKLHHDFKKSGDAGRAVGRMKGGAKFGSSTWKPKQVTISERRSSSMSNLLSGLNEAKEDKSSALQQVAARLRANSLEDPSEHLKDDDEDANLTHTQSVPLVKT